jgi:hypothetical protein
MEVFSYRASIKREVKMRRLTLTFLAGAAAIVASSAYAADEIPMGDSSPVIHQTRLVCNEAGQCWHTRADRRVIIRDGDTYYYAPRRYDDDYDRGYYREPSVGIRGPGFRFGFGPGW